MTYEASSPLPPRVGRLKLGMAREDVDVIVSFKPENSFYFTGFNPIIYSHPVIAILTPDHDPIMLVHALRDDHGRASAWVPDIRLYGAWSTKVTMGPNWQDALASILEDLHVAAGTVGIEEEFLSVQRFSQLSKVLPNATFRNVSPLIDGCRLIKDPDEIANSRIAGKIVDAGMDAAIAALAAGGNERRYPRRVSARRRRQSAQASRPVPQLRWPRRAPASRGRSPVPRTAP